jgi:hypothetical protein
MTIAVIALVGSIISSILVVYAQLHSERRRERREAQSSLQLYREPLISAAYDLQSRIYNILRRDFLVYVAEDRWDRRKLALDTTIFAFAQYFGWREILRREIRLLEFETQAVSRLLNDITGTFGSDEFGRAFLMWTPEQRGIGEAMIGTWREAPSCVGYLEFSERRPKELAVWVESLERDLVEFAEGNGNEDRLLKVQHLLVSLIELLDPKRIRSNPDRLERA